MSAFLHYVHCKNALLDCSAPGGERCESLTWVDEIGVQGPVSISDKTSYCKISWSIEAARFVFRFVRSLWNLTGTSAALLSKCLSNFKEIWWFKIPISRLRDTTRSHDKTSYRILKRGPGPIFRTWYKRRVHLLLVLSHDNEKVREVHGRFLHRHANLFRTAIS